MLVLAAGWAETPQRFSLIIYTFLPPRCTLKTTRTQSACDSTLSELVCVCVCTDCVCGQTVQIIAKTRHTHPRDNIKSHLDKHAQIKSLQRDTFGEDG